MPVRPELARKLHETLGPEAADQMVEWMREVDRTGSRDVALRGDIAELRHATKTDLAELRDEMRAGQAGLRDEMRAGQAGLRDEMHAGQAGLRDEMRAADTELREEMRTGFAELRLEMRTGFSVLRREMAEMEARFERRFSDLIKWSFVFWVGAVGAIAMLAGILG